MKNKIKVSYNAPVVLTFVLICFLATLIGIITNGSITILLFSTYRTSLLDPLFYLRLFTHVIGHNGFAHFIGNATYLLLLGPMLEEKYGSKILAEVFLLAAAMTGIIHCLFCGNTALMGASGIVFACIALSSFTTFEKRELPLSFVLIVILFIGTEIYNGATIHDNVSNLTHILGGAVGSGAGYLLNKKI